ncbi:cell division protein FtsL [Silanimonas sp.]|uniref:cell division protein FtsL n=1 Tax=Silanimonas sp. TaxID=1929290 RepID=UPI001BB83F70|nr:cell division protein FtsL [Silanimonas sp.]MBS3896153.1 cell division protein FtsL [Silanimonas sp.]
MSLRGFSLLLLLVLVVVTAMAVVLAHHHHRQAFIALTAAERERDALNVEFGRLQIEQATWSETNRIEQIAVEKLGMKFPEGNEVVVVQP